MTSTIEAVAALVGDTKRIVMFTGWHLDRKRYTYLPRSADWYLGSP